MPNFTAVSDRPQLRATDPSCAQAPCRRCPTATRPISYPRRRRGFPTHITFPVARLAICALCAAPGHIRAAPEWPAATRSRITVRGRRPEFSSLLDPVRLQPAVPVMNQGHSSSTPSEDAAKSPPTSPSTEPLAGESPGVLLPIERVGCHEPNTAAINLCDSDRHPARSCCKRDHPDSFATRETALPERSCGRVDYRRLPVPVHADAVSTTGRPAEPGRPVQQETSAAARQQMLTQKTKDGHVRPGGTGTTSDSRHGQHAPARSVRHIARPADENINDVAAFKCIVCDRWFKTRSLRQVHYHQFHSRGQ